MVQEVWLSDGEQSYKETTSDHSVFVQKFSYNDFIILLLYVNDILFAMKDLRPTKKVLGIRIVWDRACKKLYMSHEQYIEKVIERFKMSQTKSISSPLLSHFKMSCK